ncbi:MAG: TraR/DksA family transcriptional regulator [Gemmataceae bacterium]|nr:TraR/DksA family transcriptional regulator [Gemmata sp.]MDW8199344.1 TraR/DksA family transcriptional regulator [Gemmataceae bacterium]
MNRELTTHEKNKFRQQLQALRARLLGDVKELEAEALRPTGALSGGATEDPGTSEAAEEVARTLLASEENLLNEVSAALDRLAQGTFGQCEHCSRPISRERLEAIPYARTCIRCARAGEREPV